ncbi:hypothetical protein GCM10010910_27740 [Microbacterium nanhaiense]|uniref:Helix-turn-helix domain-containing protein n=1 Tax=Microbacterium nanhaiense TaxID=1301026 RepID=A0ABQ2N3Q7_9MICO|nr:helix-turn-helix domain-containing protein [Microbacterium nanhaiense]GGO66992.1 hypothetical protein GCM10010910_27740 [Microbacterium nanhaiense]
MSTQVLSPTSAIIEDQVRDDAQELLSQAHDRRIVGAKLVLDDGTEITVPQQLSELLGFVVAGVTQGSLSIRSMPDELTSNTAAQLIGISRPTLMKIVGNGGLASHKVGSHHRFTLADVQSFIARRRADQHDAFEALREIDAG